MKRKGFTLIELVLVIALLGLTIVPTYNFLIYGTKAHTMAVDEFEIQSATRLFTEQVNNITRFATATHTVPKSSFQGADHRDPSWSYLGINSSGDVVLDEPGENEGDPRKVTVIAEKREGIEYTVEFLPAYRSDGSIHDTLINFVIQGLKNGRVVMEMSSEVEVLNSLQIEHNSSMGDPAVALSFTRIDRDSPEFINVSPDAHVAMVLDESGSMDWAMAGQYQSGDSRINILKEKARDMIDKLSNMGFDIYVSIIPFSYHANNVSDIVNINKNNPDNDLAYVYDFIDDLDPGGNTNTGDGLRRAYYQLETMADDFMNDPDNEDLDEAKKYQYFTQHMMVLVDGATNLETRQVKSSRPFSWWPWWSEDSSSRYFDDRLVDWQQTTGNTRNSIEDRSVNTSDRDKYIEEIGEKLITALDFTNKDGVAEQVIKPFVIGFSGESSDHVSLEAIGNSTNAKEFEQPNGTIKRFIIATNADELDFAFGSFTEEVSASLWSIYGPSLE